MRMRKMMKATVGGTPSHIVVCPEKRASTVTARQKQRTARENMHLIQKKRLAPALLGGSLDSMGFPANIPTSIWMRYEACKSPENSMAMATQRVKSP